MIQKNVLQDMYHHECDRPHLAHVVCAQSHPFSLIPMVYMAKLNNVEPSKKPGWPVMPKWQVRSSKDGWSGEESTDNDENDD